MRNHPYGFDIYLVNVKTIRTIAQIFVAFSEKLNFIDNFCQNIDFFKTKLHVEISLKTGQKLTRTNNVRLDVWTRGCLDPKMMNCYFSSFCRKKCPTL